MPIQIGIDHDSVERPGLFFPCWPSPAQSESLKHSLDMPKMIAGAVEQPSGWREVFNWCNTVSLRIPRDWTAHALPREERGEFVCTELSIEASHEFAFTKLSVWMWPACGGSLEDSLAYLKDLCQRMCERGELELSQTLAETRLLLNGRPAVRILERYASVPYLSVMYILRHGDATCRISYVVAEQEYASRHPILDAVANTLQFHE